MIIHLNGTSGHIPVKTPDNVRRFLDETNGMHDAYLLSADYRTHVRTNHYTTTAYCEGESLVLRYQVTSLPDLPIVELTFLGIPEWKAPDGELFCVLVSFDTPFVIFFDGSNHPEDATTRVKARKMYWRIVDRPGNHLQRGGTVDAVWYVIPGLRPPMSENPEDYAQIVEELAATVPNAKIYHHDEDVQPLPDKDIAITTKYLHSFRTQSTTYAGGNGGFCWYELTDRKDLKEAVSRLHHGNPISGNMIAICDDGGTVFTVEMIERGSFNMVICSRRGRLHIDVFCNGKYHVEPYSGGGMEELS